MADDRNEPDVLDEVPEADAQEQRRGLVDDEEIEEDPAGGFEVPDADALEQSRTVGDPDRDHDHDHDD